MAEHYGYLGIALAMGLNCLGLPFPSEAMLPLSGWAIQQGHMNGWALVSAVIMLQMAGLLASYWLVRWMKRSSAKGVLANHQVRRLQQLLVKRGSIVVLMALCLPGVHGFAGYAAGMAKLALWRFVIVSFVGVVLWTLTLVGLGYVAGDHLTALFPALHKTGLLVLVGVGVAWVVWYSKHHRAYSSRKTK